MASRNLPKAGPMRPACVPLGGTKGLLPPRGPGGGPIFSAVGRIRSGRSAISHSSVTGLACARPHVPHIQLLGNDGLDRFLTDREHAAPLNVETELFGLGVTDLAEAT